MNPIHVVDYGMANLGSIANMIKHVGGVSTLCSDPEQLENADAIILPGVGHFGEAMNRLRERGWYEALQASRERGAWVLGICLGMQLMTRSSEEGEAGGLGWVPLDTVRFPHEGPDGERLRVPHMGWNHAESGPQEFEGWREEGQVPRYYFVHSYFVDGHEHPSCFSKASYGGIPFAAGIRDDRVVGVQFHPEKSQKMGLQLLTNFVNLI